MAGRSPAFAYASTLTEYYLLTVRKGSGSDGCRPGMEGGRRDARWRPAWLGSGRPDTIPETSGRRAMALHSVRYAARSVPITCLSARGDKTVAKHRIYTTSFASVYPHYVAKAERKGREKAEVDEIIRWLTGYSQAQLESVLEKRTDFETFFAEAPRLNPARTSIKGVICGVRIEEIEEPTMREIRYLDKLIDELAKGRPMEKILRS